MHATSTTLAVVGPSGRRLKTAVIETNGKALIEALKTIPEPRHVCLEEGAQAEWLFQILKPHAMEVVVTKVESSRGQKSDAKDAFGLAELLRTGKIGTRVFKDVGSFATLRDLSRLYSMLRDDVVRTKNRIKSLYRSRGVATPDGDVYAAALSAPVVRTVSWPMTLRRGGPMTGGVPMLVEIGWRRTVHYAAFFDTSTSLGLSSSS